MVNNNKSKCPKCGGELRFYDKVHRILRTKNGKTKYVLIDRYKCLCCNAVHRVIPHYISPYKQYEKEIIIGVVEGLITSETLGFEDYPCEMTMQRWRAKFTTSILKR